MSIHWKSYWVTVIGSKLFSARNRCGVYPESCQKHRIEKIITLPCTEWHHCHFRECLCSHFRSDWKRLSMTLIYKQSNTSIEKHSRKDSKNERKGLNRLPLNTAGTRFLQQNPIQMPLLPRVTKSQAPRTASKTNSHENCVNAPRMLPYMKQ